MRDRGTDHPAREQLLGYAEGVPMPLSVELHLERCAACRADFDEMDGLVRRMRTDQLVEPPEELVEAVARWPGAEPELAPIELVASLVQGLAPATHAFVGVRGPETVRELRFEGGDLVVDLELTARGESQRVRGQVLAPSPGEQPAVAAVEVAGRTLARVPVGDHGDFLLEGVPRGGLTLVLTSDRTRLRIETPPESDP